MQGLRLLQVHPWFGIGGVERHLLDLIAGLVRRGNHVTLLTEGGEREAEAEAAGAELIKTTFDPDGFDEIAQSLGPNGSPRPFDLIHAHNYKAARLSRQLVERLSAPYLMTVHGPRPFWQRLAFRDWSDVVIVMNDGDRDDVTALGGISSSRTISSFYGIDTERFRPGLETRPLQAELGLPNNALAIVHVSRFSNRKAKIAIRLIEIMSAASAIPTDAVILMVGEGPALEQLRQRAKQLNQRLGRDAVRVIGPRLDVERFMNIASVVVATGITAREALACEVPVIAAGRHGYFGRVSPGNFDVAVGCNFADTGRCHPLNTSRMADDILAIINDHASALNDSRRCRWLIEQGHSAQRMSDQIEGIYRSILERWRS